MTPGDTRDGGLVGELRDRGLPATRVLGRGMEGTVVEVADGTVVKVWASRTVEELDRLRDFYAAVDRAGLRLRVPTILDVFPLGTSAGTRQPRLAGTVLWDRPGVSPPVTERTVDALVGVLSALAEVKPLPELAVLPVMDGERPFDPGRRFGCSLADLVESRVTAGPAPLRARLPGLDDLVSATTSRLRDLPATHTGLVHGDLVPGNILVDGDAPPALLDFGFLSTLGDPVFDAAACASVFDMYGPDATKTEEILDRAFARRLDFDEEQAWLYRAAYALATATCYSPSGSDGHFDWCVRMLGRPRVREVLAG